MTGWAYSKTLWISGSRLNGVRAGDLGAKSSVGNGDVDSRPNSNGVGRSR